MTVKLKTTQQKPSPLSRDGQRGENLRPSEESMFNNTGSKRTGGSRGKKRLHRTSATLQLGSVGLTEFCKKATQKQLSLWSLELCMRLGYSRARMRDQKRSIHPRGISVPSWDL